MSMTGGMVPALCGAALIAAIGCGAPGLPPGGPGPGEVDVGYGTRDEEDVTGAVSSVSKKQLGDAGVQHLEELLRGRVAGLQILHGPGGQIVLRIRGTNSLLNDREPLIVVDGIQLETTNLQSALAGLIPQDIRQVDVLKDVSSTSIYGSRGSGGVILITTTRR